MATNLYRHFDSAGRLLYVGIAKNALARLSGHKVTASWFSEIASVTVEHFSRRRDAERAERKAIREEGPLFNTVRYPRKKPARRRPAPRSAQRSEPDRYRPQFGPGGDYAVIAGHYARLITPADIREHRRVWGRYPGGMTDGEVVKYLNEVKGSKLPPMKSSNSLTNWRKDDFRGWTPPTDDPMELDE